jgi:hypothetical protein
MNFFPNFELREAFRNSVTPISAKKTKTRLVHARSRLGINIFKIVNIATYNVIKIKIRILAFPITISLLSLFSIAISRLSNFFKMVLSSWSTFIYATASSNIPYPISAPKPVFPEALRLVESISRVSRKLRRTMQIPVSSPVPQRRELEEAFSSAVWAGRGIA